jgi:hypothetical protein
METSTTRAWVAAMLLTIGLGANAQEPGFRLGDAAKPVSYEWHLAIDPNETTFGAQVRIEIEIQRATPVLWLNATELKVESAQVHQDGNRVEATATAVGEDHLRIEPRGGAGFAPGTATVTLRYRGPIEPVSTRGLFRQQEGGDWYVVSQFEAISARRAVPCFDEPGFKTPWRIAIDAPEGNQVVANTPEVMLSDVLDRKGWKRHDFATTKALPSYLIAFGVGPFDIVDGGTAGMNNTPLRYIAPKGRGAETRYARIATPAHPGAARAVFRQALSLREARCDGDTAGGGLRRHGECGPHHVRVEPVARHAARGNRLVQAKLRFRRRARDGPHVVRRSRDPRVVGRHLAERSIRHVDRGEGPAANAGGMGQRRIRGLLAQALHGRRPPRQRAQHPQPGGREDGH